MFISQAVERFVTVGETIADDNQDIKQDMYDACKEARAAGEAKNIYELGDYWKKMFWKILQVSLFKIQKK